MGHLAALGDVFPRYVVLPVLIVRGGGVFQLRLLVLDGVPPAVGCVRAEIALGRVHLPGTGEVGFVGCHGGSEAQKTRSNATGNVQIEHRSPPAITVAQDDTEWSFEGSRQERHGYIAR